MALVKKRFGSTSGFYHRSFSERVVALALRIPRGRVVTYGDLAAAAGGGALAAQSITSILSKAYEAGSRTIPFHRIVYANGRVWLDVAHRNERLALYRQESIELDERERVVDFETKRFDLRTLIKSNRLR